MMRNFVIISYKIFKFKRPAQYSVTEVVFILSKPLEPKLIP